MLSIHSMSSFPDCIEQWPDQWRRLVDKQGEPTPIRALKNGKSAEELEGWADNCNGKVAYYLGRATGDGFWECKVSVVSGSLDSHHREKVAPPCGKEITLSIQAHWFESRRDSLRDDASVLRKEGAPAKRRETFRSSPYSASDRPSILRSSLSGAIRPLSPPRPSKEEWAPEEGKRRQRFAALVNGPGATPFQNVPVKAPDLSAFSISTTEVEDGKKLVAYTPPSSPSQEE